MEEVLSTYHLTPQKYQEYASLDKIITYEPAAAKRAYIHIFNMKNQTGVENTVITVSFEDQRCVCVVGRIDFTCEGNSSEITHSNTLNIHQWTMESVETKVIVMTPEVIRILLRHRIFLTTDFYIFEKGDLNIRQMMRRICDRIDINDCSRIVKTSRVLLTLAMPREKQLSMILNLNPLLEIKGHAEPFETWIRFEPAIKSSVAKNCKEIIDQALDILKILEITDAPSANIQLLSWHKKLKSIFEDIQEHLNTQGVYFASQCTLFYMVQLEKVKKLLFNRRLLKLISCLITYMTRIRLQLQSAMEKISEEQKPDKFTCDQLQKLFFLLKNHYKLQTMENEKFHCIILVQRQITAKILNNILTRLSSNDKHFHFLLPDYSVRNSSDLLTNEGEILCLQKWSAEAVEKFQEGTVNCLIATDPLDDGVYLPPCSLVIRYDIPETFEEYLQSKERCRHISSHVIFAGKDDVTLDNRYSEHIARWI